jgi:hypothetical protein
MRIFILGSGLLLSLFAASTFGAALKKEVAPQTCRLYELEEPKGNVIAYEVEFGVNGPGHAVFEYGVSIDNYYIERLTALRQALAQLTSLRAAGLCK